MESALPTKNVTPITMAIHWGNPDVISRFIENLDLNKLSPDGKIHLNTAIEVGRLSIVKLLIDNGADVNLKINGHNTPLCIAAKKGTPEIIKLLIDSGADTSSSSWWNDPLYFAVTEGPIENLKILVERASDSQINNDKLNDFLLGVEGPNEIEKADFLIQKGADVNTGKGIRTPLHAALYASNLKMFALLLGKGADPDIPNSQGKSVNFYIKFGDRFINNEFLDKAAKLVLSFNHKLFPDITVSNDYIFDNHHNEDDNAINGIDNHHNEDSSAINEVTGALPLLK